MPIHKKAKEQKREIISYAKENPKLTQQQITDNLIIKWDLFILMSLYKCKTGP
jgi:ABC-type iron transport system FetAB ATPase subunit